ncbi:flippase [Candidatus Borrarchaeum sp.]|uniref:flippase n=1 Tax=Candidatus Borrarchaeum sp. TaxID=2846742 RepID=UPI00257E8678|nr:flippase [Candidatus Borrarchaeum sp.]
MTTSRKSKVARDIARGSSALMIQKISLTIMGVVYGAVLARLLGPLNIGLIALANSIAFLIGIMSGVVLSGLKPAMIRHLAYYIASKEYGIAKDIYKKGLIMHLIVGSISTVLIIITADMIANLVFNSPELTLLITLTAFSISVEVANRFVGSLFESLKFFGSYSTLIIINTGGRMALSLLLFFIGYGVPGVIAGGIIAGGFTSIIGYLFIRKKLPFIHAKPESNDDNGLKKLFSFSIIYSISYVFYTIYQQAPYLILGYYLTPDVVGYYSYAYNIANRPSMLGYTFYTTLLPSMSEIYAEDDIALMRKTYSSMIKYLMVFSTFFSMLIIVFARELIIILAGPEFLPAVPLLQILSLVSILRIIGAPMQAVLLTFERLDFVLYPTALRSVMIVVLLFLLVPPYGYIIVPIVVVISWFVSIVMAISLTNREISVHIPISNFIKPVMCLLISSSVLLLPLLSNYILYTIIKLFGALTLFLISVVLTSTLIKEDIKTIELVKIRHELIAHILRKGIKVLRKILR